MFKKALQIVVTFGVLVGAYQAYLVAFAILITQIGGGRSGEGTVFVPHEGKVAKEATAYGIRVFGKDSWVADPKLPIRLYDKERGFYMYAENYERLDGGKKLRFWPFALIWKAKDGPGLKSASSVEAFIELNEPLGLLKPGTPSMHVVEARLEQDVVLRDDKGTPDPADDTVVDGDGRPLPYIEYTEKTSPAEIRTTEHVRVIDQKMTLTGTDLLILMRKGQGPAGSPGGFDAETVFLKKDPRIVMADVGKSGVMPGQARGKAATTSGPTPATVKSDGEMRVDLPPKPKALRPDFDGPPEQEGPTFVTFRRNVEVVRGRDVLDTLNCDTLRLTLLPAEKQLVVESQLGGAATVLGAACFVPGAGGMRSRYGSGGGDADGPLGGLVMREANATGYAVWLVSASQGVEVKGNELIWKKLLPAAPDETYVRADRSSRLHVTKIDRDGTPAEPGPVKMITTIDAADAKIFDDGQGGSASSVIARGPGELHARPGFDKSEEHSATWSDELRVVTKPLSKAQLAEIAHLIPKDQPPPTRREITLVGDPVLIDHTQAMTLTAKGVVFANLLPNPGGKRSREPAGAKPGGSLVSGSMRIERVRAREQVVLTAPGKTFKHRDELNALFVEEKVVVAKADSPTARPGRRGAQRRPRPLPRRTRPSRRARPPRSRRPRRAGRRCPSRRWS